MPGLRRAQAAYYARRFGVKLNPDTQVVATLGSKEGFANVAQAITAPGDVVLVPDPSYPIHAFGFLMAGGVIRSVPSEPTPDFFATLERAITHSIPKPIAVVVCYPSNPTAHVADLDFYKELVPFAKKHGIFILSDLAYAEVYFDDNPPPSVLQVPGAMDVTVEFTSMSKTYSMPGWRMGFAVGNERIIAALGRVKSYLDYGAFTPIQVAATAALNGPRTSASRRCARPTSAAATCWSKASAAPAGGAAARALDVRLVAASRSVQSLGVEFSKLLVENADVGVAGHGFGERGEGFVRIALVETTSSIPGLTTSTPFLKKEEKEIRSRKNITTSFPKQQWCSTNHEILTYPWKLRISGSSTTVTHGSWLDVGAATAAMTTTGNWTPSPDEEIMWCATARPGKG